MAIFLTSFAKVNISSHWVLICLSYFLLIFFLYSCEFGFSYIIYLFQFGDVVSFGAVGEEGGTFFYSGLMLMRHYSLAIVVNRFGMTKWIFFNFLCLWWWLGCSASSNVSFSAILEYGKKRCKMIHKSILSFHMNLIWKNRQQAE